MDILNFISWIASRRRVVTSAPDDALVPIGIRTETRDDKYTTVAIKKSDLITTPEPAYKVYTALLTQSGGDDPLSISEGTLTIGVTYYINDTVIDMDFTNVGAPNNNVGTYFVATGTNPNWGTNPLESAILFYNTGTPVVTVLENTIGNIWFTYNSDGFYGINSNGLFTNNKSVIFITNTTGDINSPSEIVKAATYDLSSMYVASFSTGAPPNSINILYNTPIEIRVYN
jgi:hypothetical protein